ncbi:MAG TPA: lytic murein transglycosylase, partial [Arenibaculum sp.]|nr:lytic murein transglycosylase [Arenibaculum sp.]
MNLVDRMGAATRWLLSGVFALLVLGWSAGNAGAATDFAAWVGDLRREAVGRGISTCVLDAALHGVAPLPRVIELDRKQPERTITFARYLDRVVTPARVRRGRALHAEHRALLEEIGHRYGVQPRFIVALWGIETDFGRNTGGFDVIAALATLAYDGRRSAYFRSELLDALEILEQGHVRPEAMKGSWAGAMGQCQFMPSSFRRYAVDADGDGRRDIWSTLPDVFASTANYLGQAGWNPRYTWGREV